MTKSGHQTKTWGVALASLLCVTSGESVTLVENGAPRATIVIGAAASGAERFAARELQRYVRVASGAELPIKESGVDRGGSRVLLGTPNSHPDIARLTAQAEGASDTPLSGPQAFVLKSTDDMLVIAGGGPAGVVYGVYDFLERTLGCVWFAPGDDVVPRRTTVTVEGLDAAAAPDLRLRASYAAFRGNDVDQIDWLGKLKSSHVMGYIGLLKVRAYGPGLEEERARNPDLADDYVKTLSEAAGLRGMHLAFVVHSYWYFLPYEKYFAAHPEYYSLIDGKRYAHAKGYHWQYCVSNPDVLDEVSENVIAFFKKYPGINLVSMDPNDGSGDCQCEACRALDKKIGVNRYLWFADQVARRIKDACPGKTVSINIGYPPCMLDAPPEEYPLSENLMFMRGFLNRSFAHPLSDPDMNPRGHEALEAWGSPYGSRLYTLSILYNIFGTRDMMAAPYWETMRGDWQYLHNDLHLWGGSSMGAMQTQNWPLEYVYKHILWDADATVPELLDHYATGFGPAQAPMREVLRLLNTGMHALRKEKKKVWTDFRSFVDRMLWPEDVDRIDVLFEQAHAAVSSDTAAAGRVDRWQKRWDSLRKYWYEAYKGQTLIPEKVNPPFVVHDSVQNNLIVIGEFTPKSLRDYLDEVWGVGQQMFYEEGTDRWICTSGLVLGNPLRTQPATLGVAPRADRARTTLTVKGNLMVEEGARFFLDRGDVAVQGGMNVGLNHKALDAREIPRDEGSALLTLSNSVLRVKGEMRVESGGGFIGTDCEVHAQIVRILRERSGCPTRMRRVHWLTREGLYTVFKRGAALSFHQCRFENPVRRPALSVLLDDDSSPLTLDRCVVKGNSETAPGQKERSRCDLMIRDMWAQYTSRIDVINGRPGQVIIKNPNAVMVRYWPLTATVRDAGSKVMSGITVRMESSLGPAFARDTVTDDRGQCALDAPAQRWTAEGVEPSTNMVSVMVDGRACAALTGWTPHAAVTGTITIRSSGKHEARVQWHAPGE